MQGMRPRYTYRDDKVKVLEVDVARKRISFTMRLDDTPTPSARPAKNGPTANKGKAQRPRNDKGSKRNTGNAQPQNSAMGNAFADAFAKAKK